MTGRVENTVRRCDRSKPIRDCLETLPQRPGAKPVVIRGIA